jgi:predicted dehydrogenase
MGGTGPDRVRFAIVGPGLAGAVHAAALERIEDARLTVVVGGSEGRGRGRALADRFGARSVTSLDELLADPSGVDAVIVATPHPLHADEAIAAARAGLHVVVEKPMALATAEADAMVAAADASSVRLAVISQRRWYPAVERVKTAIDTGRIGMPALATVELLGWRSSEYYAMDAWRGTRAGEGGGVLVNQAPHLLELLCWFLGQPVEVDGWTANVNHSEIEVEDSAVAVIRFARGALVTLVVSNAQRPGLHGRIHVHGSTGASVGVETERGAMFVAGMTAPSLARNDIWTIPGEEDQPATWAAADADALAGVDIQTHFHELQLRAIVAALRDGRQPPVSGREARRAVALMAGIAAAARTGGRIRLDAPGTMSP